MLTVSVMLRRTAFERVGGFDESLRHGLEDYEFWVRLADAGMWGARHSRGAGLDPSASPQTCIADIAGTFRVTARRFRVCAAPLRARYPHVFRDGPPAVAR
jgi:hypothetical protein